MSGRSRGRGRPPRQRGRRIFETWSSNAALRARAPRSSCVPPSAPSRPFGGPHPQPRLVPPHRAPSLAYSKCARGNTASPHPTPSTIFLGSLPPSSKAAGAGSHRRERPGPPQKTLNHALEHPSLCRAPKGCAPSLANASSRPSRNGRSKPASMVLGRRSTHHSRHVGVPQLRHDPHVPPQVPLPPLRRLRPR